MFKTLDVSYTEGGQNEERLKRITEILAEGVFAYLREGGYLKEDTERIERIRLIDKKAKVGTNHEME